MRVLLIDDSVIIRDRLIASFSSIEGVDVVSVAGSAEEALAKAERLRPDVLILDLRLPGASGVEALPELKALVPSAHVIVYTNYPYEPYRRQCLAFGADFFLDKSKDFPWLGELIGLLAAGMTVSEIRSRETRIGVREALEG